MKDSPLNKSLLGVGIAALLVCLASSVAFFLGSIDAGSFKAVFLVASVVWFVSAGTYSRR